jgi:tRNA A37 threonylcarbamoyladenosine dehydratase
MTTSPDWRSRTRLLYGDAGVSLITDATVLVAGLGAVGSVAVEALARTGVGHLVLVDFDIVEPSNINRQLYALESTIGRAKCDVALERVRDINPDCDVVLLPERLPDDPAALARLLASLPSPGVIIDAIDDIEAKAALVIHGLRVGIPVISSMGAARRFDPSQVRTGRLADVAGCPLAKGLRRALRVLLSTAGGFPGVTVENLPASYLTCVYSHEAPVPQVSAPEFGPRAMGSSICVTGTFGLVAAAAALNRLLSR